MSIMKGKVRNAIIIAAGVLILTVMLTVVLYYYEDKSMELFNLKNDRMERNNLVNLQPTLAKELYTRLMKWLIDTRADIPTELNPAYIKAKKQ